MFRIYRTISNILIEMFDPFETEFIRNLIILVYPNDPIGRRRIVAISIFQIILTYHNNKWRYHPTVRIDTLDYNNSFPIVKLYSFNFLTPVIQRYNKSRYNLVYKK